MAYVFVRERSAKLDKDRALSEDIETLAESILSGQIRRNVEAAIGELEV
jgi:histidine ammonia-lyase